ncbi:hypothetical protein ACIO3O_37940 [Streptomyces sp. NPDC087440]|uniref:hypothetical protein n=1 Tax=Streptomyces sp. NPDC087440 TaxID=3365790 RepID=UPI0038293D78
MTGAVVTTGHLTSALVLPADLDTGPALAAADTLPGGWQLHPSMPLPPGHPTVHVATTAQEPDVVVHGETVRLRLPHEAASGPTLAYAVYTATERARQFQRKVTVHANAAVHPGGRAAVVLFGTKGAGKTALTLALGERGWTHAGDDLVVLGDDRDHVTLWPGKPTAAVRPADPARWQHPKPVIGLDPFLEHPVPVTLFVRITIHPALPTAQLAPATPFHGTEQLRLHEALGRYISGLPTPLTGPVHAPYGPVWPLDTGELARWRSSLIARMESSPYAYLHAPDPQSAADLITRETTS